MKFASYDATFHSSFVLVVRQALGMIGETITTKGFGDSIGLNTKNQKALDMQLYMDFRENYVMGVLSVREKGVSGRCRIGEGCLELALYGEKDKQNILLLQKSYSSALI